VERLVPKVHAFVWGVVESTLQRVFSVLQVTVPGPTVWSIVETMATSGAIRALCVFPGT
jgi:hypothetical protein